MTHSRDRTNGGQFRRAVAEGLNQPERYPDHPSVGERQFGLDLRNARGPAGQNGTAVGEDYPQRYRPIDGYEQKTP